MPRILRFPKQASLPISILVVGLAIAAYFVGNRPRALPNPPQEKVWSVKVTEIVRRDVQPKIRVFGEITAGREAEIRAMVAGRLVELNSEFRNGELVHAGQQLAVIDPVDYEIGLAERRAELDQADALLREYRSELKWETELLSNAERQVELAQRGLERSSSLALSGRESQKARDDSEIALTSAEQTRMQRSQAKARLAARIEQQRAAYGRAQAVLASAERDLAHTRVVAPYEGHLADVKLALGQRVAVGESLGRLLAAAELEARFEIPEADFARLLSAQHDEDAVQTVIGQQIEVAWRLGEKSLEFEGVISRIGAEIDPAMGGIELYAVLAENASDVGLRAGAFVQVRLADVEYQSVFLLPAKAVSDDGRAYLLDGDRLRAVDVKILRTIGDEVIVDAAFDDGARIVANQFAGIGPGLKARAL